MCLKTKAVFLSAPCVIFSASFLEMNRSSKRKLDMSFLLGCCFAEWNYAPLLL
jgi:hypothetical protein